ncbi:MAG: hypothetical protein R3B09_13540 [Nannocystaceae bacterium]
MRTSDRRLLLAFVLSGAAGLGYEILWTRLLGLSLGHETLGILGTLAGFFAGMAVGAAALHRRAAEGPDPIRLFGRLEVTAAIFAALSPHLLHALAAGLPRLLGPIAGDNHSAGALVLSLVVATVVLLPGTFCLGATLPALVAAHRRARPEDGGPRGLGRLYAANTIGATAGVMLAVYALVPGLGYAGAAIALAGLGVGAALLARAWGRGALASSTGADPAAAASPEVTPTIDTGRDPDPDLLGERWILHALSFGTGLCGVGLEVVGLQILGQRLENTVFTFADVLAVYLVGTAIGAAIYQRLAPQAVGGRPATVLAGMLLALAMSVVLAAIALGESPAILAAFTPEAPGLAGAAAAELAVAAAIFLIPTALMGALFSHVVGLVADRGAGRAYALNTLGCALAPYVFGVAAIPALGYSDALYVVAYAYLALFVGFCWLRRFPTAWLLGGALAVVIATALGPRSLVLIEADPPWTIVDQRQTLSGVLTVSERRSADPNSPPLRRLQVGQHFRMGGSLSFGEQRMGHLPALLALGSRRALFLGVGAGATVGAVADLEVERVDAIELVPEVLELLPHFESINRDVAHDPRFHLRAADARRAIAAMAVDERYPLIVGDLFHPGRDGAGSLYAEEHFQAIREHLEPGGIYCQWLPLHQLDEASLGAIVRTFLAVFGDAHAFLGIYNAQTPSLALVGAAPGDAGVGLRIDLAALEVAVRRPGLTIVEARDLLASYLLDRAGLEALAGDGPVNRDLAPQVLFSAPRAAYADDPTLGAQNLARLLDRRVPYPDALVTGDPAALADLRAATDRYREALGHYLRAEIARAARGEGRPVLEDMEGLLAAYAADPTFPPARGLLYAAAEGDPTIAGSVLPRMREITPNEPRVYQAYLRHLQRVGDREAFERVLAEAQARFPGPGSGSAPQPSSEPSAPPPTVP